ncbi:MAG: hypothetical protein K9W46_05700 [Candidatus Heimdallarchaeum endolithica]|uniref:TFIIB-type domain-containing protein n=1 Tax=Candidatus Heimdallarchaeum endolithica TaxID=2876572 RepID=A0A9Y1BTG0_9ARCH|nr:MAG: hypothetical protein K9W46_05700 [Candidatus Heimdallarchaeum endolithica]
MSVVQLKCKICGAPIDINPEDAIYNCNSCGQAFTADGKTFENHYFFPNSLNKDKVHEIVGRFIKKNSFLRGIKNYSIKSIKPMLLPFWIVRTRSNTHFLGYLKYSETRTRTSGKSTTSESVTVYRPIEEDINEDRTDVILARRATVIFGYKKVKKLIERNIENMVHFDINLLKDKEHEFQYLSTEFSDIDANQLIKTKIFDEHRRKAEKKCTKVFDCYTQITFLGTFFTHFPVWLVEYDFKGETYRVVINGNNGEIIKGEIPVTKLFRIINFSLSILMIAFGILINFFYGKNTKLIPWLSGGLVAVLLFFTINNTFKPLSVIE